jgi:hypothetical protein
VTQAPRASLPPRLTLPSGAVVHLTAKSAATRRPPLRREDGAPLFSEVFALVERGNVTVDKDLASLPLGDFHVLRAVLTKAGLLDEAPVAIPCDNCGAELRVSPCAALEIGPWVDGELGDPELDATLPFGEPHPIPPITVGRVRAARTVTFEPRSAGEARALFAAGPTLRITPAIVRAMGIVALGDEKDPARIARALAAASDEAFDAVADAFLASHYPARLGGVAFCPECRARNDVDAPYERELEPSRPPAAATVSDFPDFETFAERARTIGEPLLAAIPGDEVLLVVDDDTPAVDDGGIPLLGAYDPPHPGDAGEPSRPPTITIWYRSFRDEREADPGFDWDDELRETIEHELEHHVYFLRGDDPMDDEERAVIGDEARRIVGRREAERRALRGFGDSLGDFAKRTWPLWLIAALALALAYATQR